MLHYYANGKIDDWKNRRAQLSKMIANQAIILQVLPHGLGVEVYTKDQFINTLTTPTQSLQNIEVIASKKINGQIVKLKFKVRSWERLYIYIFIGLLYIGCANNSAPYKTESDAVDFIVEEEEAVISEEDALSILVKQKIQEHLDKKNIHYQHPEFKIDSDHHQTVFPKKATQVKQVTFIKDLYPDLDSLSSFITEVTFESDQKTSNIDTIITTIKTSKIVFDGNPLKTQEISFSALQRSQISKNQSATSSDTLPKSVSIFSLDNLNFTWEEINACDCLFMIPSEKTAYQKLYFGRLKGDPIGIVQLGKNTKKILTPLTHKRAKTRKPGSAWKEMYENSEFTIKIIATPTEARVKGKFTYYIDFTYTDLNLKHSVKKVILTNCKS